MVHNGIEYGVMAAYAEGLNILHNADAGRSEAAGDAETAPLEHPEYYQYEIDVPEVAEVWRRGSVIGSWLLDLTAAALRESPDLSDFEGHVSDSGEGRWTSIAAIEEGVPAPVLTTALYSRFASRGLDDFADKVALGDAQAVRRARRKAAVTEHQLEVLPDAEAAARRGAELIAERAAETIARNGSFSFAASGGTEPWEMYRMLGELEVDWERIEVFQVDERVAPDGDPDRNLTHLLASLPEPARERVRPMPVNQDDLEQAAAAYAELLPERIDLVHLGIGPDGHTASLVPEDPVLKVHDRRVAVSGEYQGHRRLTLTYPELERAGALLWLITGRANASRSVGCSPTSARYPPVGSRPRSR